MTTNTMGTMGTMGVGSHGSPDLDGIIAGDALKQHLHFPLQLFNGSVPVNCLRAGVIDDAPLSSVTLAHQLG
jgi:hypothetical protein